MNRLPAVLMAAMCFVSGASAQSLNIDFGVAGSAPSDSYSAAGLAGRWNAVGEIPQGPLMMVGLDGAPISVSLLVDFGGGPLQHDDPGTTGDDERLFDDYLPGFGDVLRHFRFVGLSEGWYRVITYAWTPGSPQETTEVLVEGQAQQGQAVGGAWPGHPVQGVTHAVEYTSVVEGPMVIVVAAGRFGDNGSVNGVQLVRIGPPCTADWDHNGELNSQDFFEFLSWFFAGYADFNGDGSTTSADFFEFVAAFFAGCS